VTNDLTAKPAAPLAKTSTWLKPGATTSRQRWALALAVAGAADLLQLLVFPAFIEGAASPFDDAVDVVVVTLLLAILGFRWRLAIGLGAELIPGVALFPTWTAVVASVRVDPKPAPLPAPAPTPPKPEM
jgi:hypothetical protein